MSFLLIFIPTIASAHPGRTDSKGGHYCRTNCAKWGLKNGEYHYHNGGSGGSKTTKKSTTTKSQSTKKVNTKTQDSKTQKKTDVKKTETKKKEAKKTNTNTKKTNTNTTTKKTESVTTTSSIILPAKQATGTLRVYYFDVDQGDSTLIITPNNRTILIDGGSKTQGQAVVKYLEGLGAKSLDVMIASHFDADHIGGLNDVLKAVNVKSLFAPQFSTPSAPYKELLNTVKNKGLTLQKAQIGVSLDIDGVTADFLAPLDEYESDPNAGSAVVKVNYKNTSFLFTSDAEAKSEGDLIANAIDVQADVLKVGKHGAKTSTSKSFIDEVLPTYSIISVGNNKQGYPDAGIIDTLKNVNSTIYRTDQQGTIIAISDGDQISFVTTKK